MAFAQAGQYVPSGYVPMMQPQMMLQQQPSMQLFPGMMAAPKPTPQFVTTPLQQPKYPWQTAVTPAFRSDSEEEEEDEDDDDFDFDEDEDDDEDWEHQRHAFLQPGSQVHLPTRGRATSFSGERGRSHSVPRELHPNLPPAPQNPYQSRFSQSAVRQFLAANAASQQVGHLTPYTPHTALPSPLPNMTYQLPQPHTPRHVPQPEVLPKFKLPKLKRSKSQGHSTWDMIPNHEWARYATKFPIMSPDKLRGGAIKLHPLLSPESCLQLLKFNATRPPATLSSGGSLQRFLNEPATAPPLNQIHVWTGVHAKFLTITNPSGVTVGNILGILGDQLFQKLPKAIWYSFDEAKREEVGNWFWHNRKHGLMPPVKTGVVYADLLGASTLFSGFLPIKQNQMVAGTFTIQWTQPLAPAPGPQIVYTT